MKRHILNVLLAFVLAAVYFVPQSSSAQAKSWHAPNGGSTLWSIDPICRDGVKIQVVYWGEGDPTFSESRTLSAHPLLWDSKLEIVEPWALIGEPVIGQPYGRLEVTARFQEKLRTFDVDGSPRPTKIYGERSLRWSIPDRRSQELPLGTPVVVQRYPSADGPRSYFFGTVTDCYLFQ